MKHLTTILFLLISLTIYGQGVGIGTSTPNCYLHINAPTGEDLLRIQDQGSTKFYIEDGGNVAIGGFFDPDDALDVQGNIHGTGYLKIGNPSPPSSTSSSDWTTIYASSFDAGSAGWSQGGCGAAGTAWTFSFTSNNGVMEYDNASGYSRQYLYSPQIWIPAGTTNISAEGHFNCSLESGYDGMWLEISVDGGTWTRITSFTIGGYNDASVNGSNTGCTGTDTKSAWSGSVNGPFRTNTGTAGSWNQFRFCGVADGSDGTGVFQLYGFSIGGKLPGTVGGPFAAGNIYAEKNIYAGSNAVVGDVAEYFDVYGFTQPGDLITLTPEGVMRISLKEKDDKIIGIHSTNPTVTLNSPYGVPIALVGRTPIKVVGKVKIGDLLTSSSTRGHAMRADGPCYVIGRALESSDGGQNTIMCLIEKTWYYPMGYVEPQKPKEVVYDKLDLDQHQPMELQPVQDTAKSYIIIDSEIIENH